MMLLLRGDLVMVLCIVNDYPQKIFTIKVCPLEVLLMSLTGSKNHFL